MTDVALAPETLFRLGPLPVTNTLVVTWATMGILVGSAFVIKHRLATIPGKFQSSIEMAIESLYNLVESLADKRTALFFPLVATFFLFILIANWLALLPGFGTLGVWHEENGHPLFVPIFRAVNSDLNTTLALALISVIATHAFAIKLTGIGQYLKRFFSFNPINLFVGILELVAEFTKLVSLSFRLFGNIFAGETVLVTISALFAFVLPLPFLALEIVVGFVQAVIFAILTLVFMTILSTKQAH